MSVNSDTYPFATPTVHLSGAVGGQGTTTVATILAALAARHRPTALVAARPRDVCAIVGISPGPGVRNEELALELAPGLTLCTGRAPARPPFDGPATLTIVDGGRADDMDADHDPHAATHRWLVVRGPYYVALRAALEAAWPADGVIVVSEPGRALRAADVADVLAVPVVVEVAVDPRVARAVDAGLLLDQVTRLPSLRPLAMLVRRYWPLDVEASA